MTDHGHAYDYPPVVRCQINDDKMEDYVRAADFLNAGQFDVVSLQHEFGIFGGEAGGHIMALLSRLTMPIVTTLHTVLSEPTPVQRDVMDRIVDVSSRVIVMAEKGRELLRAVYRVPADKIEVIAHGIPDFPFVEPDQAKAKLGFSSRTVILTFGLLSPNKGIEVMIDAMPSILKSRPDAVYVVLGATHPNLVREQGEAYRDSLVARARGLGVEDHVVFLDQFVDQPTLLEFIAMCDVYVTPYLNESQMTSGTLAYSFALGKAVVSTPYWHAEELLADGRGILVPFADAAAIGSEIAGIADRRRATAGHAQARLCGQPIDDLGANRGALPDGFRKCAARASAQGDRAARPQRGPTRQSNRAGNADSGISCRCATIPGCSSMPSIPCPIALTAIASTTMPGRCCWRAALNGPGEQRLPEALTARFASFVQHAWNPDTRRFRNFMSFDRRWLEDRGSEDSHGRTLWALGECARQRCERVASAMGGRACSPKRCRRWRTSARRAPGPSRCSGWTPIAP